MHFIFRSCIVAALAFLISGISHAERPVRILYFMAPPEAPEEAYVYGGNKFIAATELPRTNFSETFVIPDGDLTLAFLPEKLEEGEKPTGTPATVSIPQSWEKVLLLAIEDEKNSTMPIQLKAINASDNVFGPGSIYMMNLSSIRVGGMVGDKKLDLRPRSVHIIKDPVRKTGSYPTQLYAIKQKGEKPQRFIKQMWGHDSTIRKVMFILPKPAPRYASYYCAPVRDL